MQMLAMSYAANHGRVQTSYFLTLQLYISWFSVWFSSKRVCMSPIKKYSGSNRFFLQHGSTSTKKPFSWLPGSTTIAAKKKKEEETTYFLLFLFSSLSHSAPCGRMTTQESEWTQQHLVSLFFSVSAVRWFPRLRNIWWPWTVVGLWVAMSL